MTKKAPPVLLNYISAPNVVIASAVVASAAVPGFIEPVRLEVKDADGNITPQGGSDELYWDGSIEQVRQCWIILDTMNRLCCCLLLHIHDVVCGLDWAVPHEYSLSFFLPTNTILTRVHSLLSLLILLSRLHTI